MRISFASFFTAIVFVLSALGAAACGGQERGQEKQPEQEEEEEAVAVESETTTATGEASEVHEMADQVIEQPPAEEIAVTGVIEDAPDKADGTPVYGIKDETTITGNAPPVGYLLEGDYSAYVGKRITVYGTPRIEAGHRILDVTWIE